MNKNKPIAPKKEEWNKDTDEFQGKQEQQRDSFAVFVVICCIITVISSLINEAILWLSK
jgi:hypothetical protein